MIFTTFESYKGGTKNISVAIDSETGLFSTSTKGKKQAIRNLARLMSARCGQYVYNLPIKPR